MYVNSQLNPTQNRYPSNPKQHDYYDESLLGTHKVGSLTHWMVSEGKMANSNGVKANKQTDPFIGTGKLGTIMWNR